MGLIVRYNENASQYLQSLDDIFVENNGFAPMTFPMAVGTPSLLLNDSLSFLLFFFLISSSRAAASERVLYGSLCFNAQSLVFFVDFEPELLCLKILLSKFSVCPT